MLHFIAGWYCPLLSAGLGKRLSLHQGFALSVHTGLAAVYAHEMLVYISLQSRRKSLDFVENFIFDREVKDSYSFFCHYSPMWYDIFQAVRYSSMLDVYCDSVSGRDCGIFALLNSAIRTDYVFRVGLFRRSDLG